MMLYGHKKGFFRLAVSMLSLLLTLAISSILFPSLHGFVKEKTGIESGIHQMLLDNIGMENISGDAVQDSRGQEEAIATLHIPKDMKKNISENNRSAIYELLGVEDFKEYVSKYISNVVLNIIVFVITCVLVWIILHILMEVLDVFAKIPVIHGLNQIAGAVLGLANGLMILWIIFLFIGAMSGTSWGAMLMESITKSSILSFIFDNNLLSTLMKKSLYGIF
ncbi:CvpA family protein [Bacteroides heparinolyticus]|uniref:CvpA family protein n=1 Tax=Prevotella heparinolytica TaxID=28113 RepID=UPI0035A0BD55